jgi:hypothetical protein
LLYAWLRVITDDLKALAKMIFFLKGAALEAFIQDIALTHWRLTCATKIPLAYRVEQGYTHLGNQGRAYKQTDRLGPACAGPAYSEDSRVRAAPRLGDQAAVETDLWRCPSGQRWVAHPALHKLEQEGWITAEWKPSENNRRAKFYSLTRLGRKELEKEAANWNRLSVTILRVVKLKEA